MAVMLTVLYDGCRDKIHTSAPGVISNELTAVTTSLLPAHFLW